MGQIAYEGDCPVRVTDLKVQLVGEPELIFPSEPTPCSNGVMFLSNLDQVVLYPIETVYFFPVSEAEEANSPVGSTMCVVEKLREALQKLLVPYYFMGGRLRLNTELYRLELQCNDAGALFAGASAGVTLAEVGDFTYPNPGFRSLVLQIQDPTSLADLPLTTVQVTRFKCGGFTLGFSSNHALLDGIAAGEFLANYASLVRGEGMRTWPKPDRTMLKARCPPHVKFEHFEYVWLPGIPFSKQPEPMMAYTEIDALGAATSRGHALMDYEYKAFHVNGQLLAQLKEAGRSHSPISTCTAFEALAAHLWQCRTVALEMAPSEFSSFLFAVDLRQCMEPPLPAAGFAGNAVLSACARARASDLVTKPLWFAVQKVQEARALINNEYARSAIDCLEINKGVPLSSSGCYVSAWWKIIKLQSLDFGWGPPIHAGPIVSALVEFVLFISDGTPDGLMVLVAMPSQYLSKFGSLFLQMGPNNTFFPHSTSSSFS